MKIDPPFSSHPRVRPNAKSRSARCPWCGSVSLAIPVALVLTLPLARSLPVPGAVLGLLCVVAATLGVTAAGAALVRGERHLWQAVIGLGLNCLLTLGMGAIV